MEKELFSELIQGINEMIAMENSKLKEDIDTQIITPHYNNDK